MTSVEPSFVDVLGRRVRVFSGGQGPALLLVHGGIGDAPQHWSAVWDELARTHFVIAPDLPGMGESEALRELGWDSLFCWLDGVLDALGVSRVHVVGNSFGGALTRLYAANRPERVERALLVNGGAVPKVPAVARLLMRTPWVWTPLDWMSRKFLFSRLGLRMMVRRDTVITDRFVHGAQKNAAGFSKLMSTLFVGDPPRNLSSQRPPALIWGAEDRSLPASAAEKLERELGGRELRMIPGAGHMPQLEAPDAFVAALHESLASAG